MTFIDTIVVPQGAEYQAVCRALKKADADLIQVMAIPIGIKNIQQTLANYSAVLSQTKNLVIMGLCGSLSQQHLVGDPVLYTNCWNRDRQQVNLQSTLTTAIGQQLSVDLVAGLTSDRLINTAKEKRQQAQIYPVSVVDMEGYDYAKIIQQRNINVSVLRVVSDDLSGDIPDLSRAIDRDGNLCTLPMAIAFLQQPKAAINLIKGSLTGLKILERIAYQLTINN